MLLTTDRGKIRQLVHSPVGLWCRGALPNVHHHVHHGLVTILVKPSHLHHLTTNRDRCLRLASSERQLRIKRPMSPHRYSGKFFRALPRHTRQPDLQTRPRQQTATGDLRRLTGPPKLRPNRVRRCVLVLGSSFLDWCALIGTRTNQGRVVKAGGAARGDDFKEHREARVSTVWFEVFGVAFGTAGKD